MNEITIPLYKEISPSIDIRIDTNNLIENKTQIPPELLSKKLFMPKETKDSNSTIWLRVHRTMNHLFLECTDPSATDLIESQHVFIQLKIYNESIGYLENFASPSFSGAKAITVVWNLMALCGCKKVVLCDGSTLLSSNCKKNFDCDRGATTSLRLLGAFKNNASWYETQGAIPEVTLSTFLPLVCAQEDGFAFGKNHVDTRLSTDKNFDKRVFERCSLYLQEWQPDLESYTTAKDFLHFLPIPLLTQSLKKLVNQYLKAQPLLNCIQEATSTNRTVGELVENVMNSRNVNEYHHVLHHEIRDRLISGKGSFFEQYASDILSTKTLPTRLSCAIAWSCIDELKGYGLSPKDLVPVLNEMLQEEKKENDFPLDDHSVIVLDRKKRLELEDACTTPPSVKVKNNSFTYQRHRQLRYEDEILTIAPISLAKQAMNYLVSVPLNELLTAYPALHTRLKGRFPLENATSIFNLYHNVSEEDQTWLMFEFFLGCTKHASNLFVEYLKKHPDYSFPVDETYPLLILAKHICRKNRYCTLRLI